MAVIRNLVVKVGADISGLTKGLRSAQNKILSVSKSMGKIGTNLSMKVTMPIMLLGKKVVDTSAQFEQSMANAASVSGATGEELAQMTKLAREMGKTTVFSASQSADAMYYMASAGYKVEQMADSIQPVLNLASATQSELAFATDTVIATLNQFGLEASSAGRVTNVFASVIGNSQATLEKLAYSMRYVGPVANSLGYSIEETTAALGLLYNSGFKGEQAGTILRGALSRLLKPTTAIEQALSKLGLSYEEVNPSTKSLTEIIGKLEKANINTAQAVAIFGQEAGPGMMALISQGSDSLVDMTSKITNTKSASEMAEKQLDTFQGSMKLLKSMVEELALSIGDILIPVLRKLTEKYVMPFVGKLQGMSRSSQELAVKIALIASAIGPMFLILSKVFKLLSFGTKILGLISSPIGVIVVAVGILIAILVRMYKTNEKFRNKVIKVWENIKNKTTKSITVMKKWWETNGESIKQSVVNVFNVIYTIIEWVISGIVVIIQKLISSLKYLWESNEAFGTAVIGIWNGIKQGIASAINFIVMWWNAKGKELWESVLQIFNLIWNVIVLVLDQIIKSVTIFLGYLSPIWSQVKAIFISLWDVLSELWTLLEPLFIALGAVIVTCYGIVIGVINGIIQALGPLIQAILNVVQIIIDIVGVIVSLLKGDFSGAMEHLRNIGKNVKEYYKNMFQALLNFCSGFVDGFLGFFNSLGVDLESIVKGIVTKISDWFSNMGENISKTATNIWSAITGVFGDIGDWFGDLFKDAYDWGANLIKCIVNGINDAVGWVEDSVNSVGQTISDFLGFSSPTKKGPGLSADSWMTHMMGMFSEGIKQGLPDIEGAVNVTAGTLKGVSTSLPKQDNSSLINGVMSSLSVFSGNQNKTNQQIELSIDSQVFARLILPSLTKEFKRNGIQVI